VLTIYPSDREASICWYPIGGYFQLRLPFSLRRALLPVFSMPFHPSFSWFLVLLPGNWTTGWAFSLGRYGYGRHQGIIQGTRIGIATSGWGLLLCAYCFLYPLSGTLCRMVVKYWTTQVIMCGTRMESLELFKCSNGEFDGIIVCFHLLSMIP